MSYAANLPQQVQEKITLLSEYERGIANLELQLQNMRTARDQLLGELLKCHIYVPSSFGMDKAPRTDSSSISSVHFGIHKLPNEMLLYIFEYFLSLNHRRIRTLLTVCRHWHHIVMESPRLWARIQISSVYFANYHLPGPSLMLYIEACLQRSQTLLLEIEVNYDTFRRQGDYIQEEVEALVQEVADESEEDEIFEWALQSYNEFASRKYDAYFDGTFSELDLLIGPEGKNMERWHTLDLCLPGWRGHYLLVLDVWSKFIGYAPNLQCAKFSQIDTVLDHLFDMGSDDEELSFTAFPMLSGLRDLTLDTFHATRFFLYPNVSSSPLQRLDIVYDHSLRVITNLSEFPLLRKLLLKTHVGEGAVGLKGEPDPPPATRLPDLEELTLWGNSHILKDLEFDFPSLRELRLCGRRGLYLHPSLFPSCVHWSCTAPMDDYWTPENTFSALKTLLQSATRAEMVTVQEFVRPFILQVLIDLKQSSSLPTSLKTIVVELLDGQREVFNVLL